MNRRLWLLTLTLLTAVVLMAHPFIDHMNNAASNEAGQAVAAGALVSIYGADFTDELAIADSIPLARQLLATKVFFNGIQSPMLFVAPQSDANPAQINAQLPWEALQAGVGNAAQVGMVEVIVETVEGRSEPLMAPVADFSPGIFSIQFGVGQAIAYNALTGIIAAPDGSIPGLLTTPIRHGQFLSILCTGLGAVTPAAETGNALADGQVRLTDTHPTVLFNDVEVQGVAALTSEFVGVYQVNVEITPNIPVGDAVSLRLKQGDTMSREGVTIAVAPAQ